MAEEPAPPPPPPEDAPPPPPAEVTVPTKPRQRKPPVRSYYTPPPAAQAPPLIYMNVLLNVHVHPDVPAVASLQFRTPEAAKRAVESPPKHIAGIRVTEVAMAPADEGQEQGDPNVVRISWDAQMGDVTDAQILAAFDLEGLPPNCLVKELQQLYFHQLRGRLGPKRQIPQLEETPSVQLTWQDELAHRVAELVDKGIRDVSEGVQDQMLQRIGARGGLADAKALAAFLVDAPGFVLSGQLIPPPLDGLARVGEGGWALGGPALTEGGGTKRSSTEAEPPAKRAAG